MPRRHLPRLVAPHAVDAASALVESLLSTTAPIESELRVDGIRALALGTPAAKQQELKEAAGKEVTFQTEQRALEAGPG